MSFYRIWIIAFFVKIVASLAMPISADESYYWVWSQKLAWSYFDHPPLVAYLIKLTEPFGNSLPFMRLPFVIIGQLSYLVWYQIFKKFFNFSTEQLKLWLILSLFSPLFGFGSLLALPDVPFIFFWSCSFYFLLSCLQSKKILDYFWLGLFLGLGFLSKYHIVLFLFCILSILVFENRWKQVSLKGVLVSLAIGLLTCTPVLYWNAMNEWISFEFQLNHGLNGKSFKIYWPLSYILGVCLLTVPFCNLKIFKFFKTHKSLYLITITPLLFFLFTSFRAHVELNWMAMSIPSFFALVALSDLSKKRILFINGVWCFVYVILFALLTIKSLNHFDESTKVKASIDQIKEKMPLYVGRYQTASLYYYYLNQPVYKIPTVNRFDYYDMLLKDHSYPKQFYFLHQYEQKLPDFLTDQGYKMSPTAEDIYIQNYLLHKVEKL